jgi:hypothetical protein
LRDLLQIDTVRDMKSVYEQRRDNLRKLQVEWGGPTSLAKKLGHSNGSYLAQLIGPHPSREISEKVAREIETKLALPSNWLDAEHGASPRQVDDNTLALCVGAVAAAVRDAGAKVAPQAYGTLVTLAYEHCKLTGRIDESFIQKLVGLTIK